RATDIPLLLEYFNTLCARKLKIKPKTFSDGATKAISRMDFPGNVAELSNMIKLIYYITNKQTIEESDISILQSSLTFDKENEDVDVFWIETKPYNLKKEEFEKKYLSTQLYLNDFNISKTAVSLDLKQPNLSRKIKELRISKKEK
ncbi:MAG: hypothetical protein FWG20_04260, partial [Candidatus Cloacimonetes bacterium]|nr:hypothetical protein [Candidatus Cloacimonadota bacterium]